MRLFFIFFINLAKSEEGTCTKDTCPDEKPKKPKIKKGALPFDPDKIKVKVIYYILHIICENSRYQ